MRRVRNGASPPCCLPIRLRQRCEKLVGDRRHGAANAELGAGERFDAWNGSWRGAFEDGPPEAHCRLTVLVPDSDQADVLAWNARLEHLAAGHAAGGPQSRQPLALERDRPFGELAQQWALALERDLDRSEEVVGALRRHRRGASRAGSLTLLSLHPSR